MCLIKNKSECIPGNFVIESIDQSNPRLIDHQHNHDPTNQSQLHPYHTEFKPKTKRYVKFPPNENLSQVVAIVQPLSLISQLERNYTWYGLNELQQFKNKIRSATKIRRSSIALFRRKLKFDIHKISNENATSFENIASSLLGSCMGDGGCDRGLELRLSVKKQRNKFVAIRSVLEAQRRLRKKAAHEIAIGSKANKFDNVKRLALVSYKFTRSAREDALRMGHMDFLSAHPYACFMPNMNSTVNSSLLQLQLSGATTTISMT